MKILRVITLVGLMSMAGSGFADIYKWTDENGQIHYGQNAPESVDATKVAAPPPPSSSAEEEKQAWENYMKKEQEAKEKEALSEGLEEKRADKVKIWKANCTAAKAKLESLEAKPRARKRGAYGKLSVMPEEELQQKISQTEKDIELYCNQPPSNFNE